MHERVLQKLRQFALTALHLGDLLFEFDHALFPVALRLRGGFAFVMEPSADRGSRDSALAGRARKKADDARERQRHPAFQCVAFGWSPNFERISDFMVATTDLRWLRRDRSCHARGFRIHGNRCFRQWS